MLKLYNNNNNNNNNNNKDRTSSQVQQVCPPRNCLDNGPFPFWFPNRSSSGNTMKDSSEEGQPQPAPKPKDKVTVAT